MTFWYLVTAISADGPGCLGVKTFSSILMFHVYFCSLQFGSLDMYLLYLMSDE